MTAGTVIALRSLAGIETITAGTLTGVIVAGSGGTTL
jgi:hypothetical protein